MSGPLGIAVVPGAGAALARGPDRWSLTDLADVPAGRLVWWRAATAAPALVAAGTRPPACWDLGAVHRLLHGGRRDDPGVTHSPGADVPEPGRQSEGLTLLDLAADDEPVRPDGSLSPDWAAEPWASRPEPGDLARASRWAELALAVQARQAAGLAALPDPRPDRGRTLAAGSGATSPRHGGPEGHDQPPRDA